MSTRVGKYFNFSICMCLGMLGAKDEGTCDSAWGGDSEGGEEEVVEHATEEEMSSGTQIQRTLKAMLRNLDLQTMKKELVNANP